MSQKCCIRDLSSTAWPRSVVFGTCLTPFFFCVQYTSPVPFTHYMTVFSDDIVDDSVLIRSRCANRLSSSPIHLTVRCPKTQHTPLHCFAPCQIKTTRRPSCPKSYNCFSHAFLTHTKFTSLAGRLGFCFRRSKWLGLPTRTTTTHTTYLIYCFICKLLRHKSCSDGMSGRLDGHRASALRAWAAIRIWRRYFRRQ